MRERWLMLIGAPVSECWIDQSRSIQTETVVHTLAGVVYRDGLLFEASAIKTITVESKNTLINL